MAGRQFMRLAAMAFPAVTPPTKSPPKDEMAILPSATVPSDSVAVA